MPGQAPVYEAHGLRPNVVVSGGGSSSSGRVVEGTGLGIQDRITDVTDVEEEGGKRGA